MKVRSKIAILIWVGSFMVPILPMVDASCIPDCCDTTEMACGMEIDSDACSFMPTNQPVQTLPAVSINTTHGNILILDNSFQYDRSPQYASSLDRLPNGIFIESPHPNIILPLLV